MMQRLGFCLLGVLIVGLAVAQDPARDDPDDPPIRLKKKPAEAPKPPMNDDKKDPAKPPMNDDKKDPAKPPMNDDKKDPAKKMGDKDEPEPQAPKEDEAEVLNRVAKNARLAEEKIANKELGGGTRQLQEDILSDLDSLIRAAESPPPQGGGGGGDSNDNQQNQQNNSKSQSGGGGSMGKQSGKQGGGSSPSPSSSRQARQQRRSGSQQAKKSGSGSDAPSSDSDPNRQRPGETGGNNGGGGAKGSEGPDKNADIYKDVWGHLPESLRAEMNAYSNDKQFMSKYDELIKRYYRSLAEEGRKKGD